MEFLKSINANICDLSSKNQYEKVNDQGTNFMWSNMKYKWNQDMDFYFTGFCY